MSKERDFVANYKEVRQDYAFDPSIFNDEPEKVRRIKEIIDALPEVDKILFIMYAECGSLRKLARRLGFSHMTLAKEIQRIRKKILETYDPNFTK